MFIYIDNDDDIAAINPKHVALFKILQYGTTYSLIAYVRDYGSVTIINLETFDACKKELKTILERISTNG